MRRRQPVHNDVPKSHLLISQILRNFEEKTNDLKDLRSRIDDVYTTLTTDGLAAILEVKPFECDPSLDDISSKEVAICVIGQSYEAKIRVVNDIFALKDNNVLEPTAKSSRRSSGVPSQHSTDGFDTGSSGIFNIIPSCNNSYSDVFNLCDLFAESESDKIRGRLGSEGRMVQLRYSQHSPEIDTSTTVGSFKVVSLYNRNQLGTGRSSLVSKSALEKTVTTKDDCCRVSFSHPLLSAASVIVSPSIPRVFNSDDIIHALKNDFIPFFIYAVEEIPLSEEDLKELQECQSKLPHAAIMFVKVDTGTKNDFSTLHGAQPKHKCEHMIETVREHHNSDPRWSPIQPSVCFVCSFENSTLLHQLKEIGFIGNGDWQIRANRCMFMENSKKMHENITTYIRRQARAYILAAITGMQAYLNNCMKKVVSHCYDLTRDAQVVPKRMDYIENSLEEIKNKRIGITVNRVQGTLDLAVSRLKLHLMDPTSPLQQQLKSIDQKNSFRGALSQYEYFMINKVRDSLLDELRPFANPTDSEPLLRLLEKLEIKVRRSKKYDRIMTPKDQPTHIMKNLLAFPFSPKRFTIGRALTLRGKILRRIIYFRPSQNVLFTENDFFFRVKCCSDILSRIDTPSFSKGLHADLLEKVAYDFEHFRSSFIILEQRLMRLVDENLNKKTNLQRKLCPMISRLLLEVTAFRDNIINGMPKLEKEIGRGQYGVVYSTKNRWAGTREGMEIAIKTMIPDNDSQWGDLSQEYFYMHYWVDQHPNIVQVLGVLIDKNYGPGNGICPSVLLVLERCESDLHTALKLKRLNDLIKRIQISVDVASGLRFLHAHGLIHRDIKLKNILLDSNQRAKISDMGFCRPTAVTEGSIVGTPVHMPPEIFTRSYNQSVDIYAFGILLWYMLRNTCKLPNNFEMCSHKEQLWRQVMRGQRPEKIHGVHPKLWSIAERCWAKEPKSRPTAGQVQYELEDALGTFDQN